MKIKIISIFVLTLLISSIVAVGSYNKNEQLSLSDEVEISIYGTLYMMKNKPLGQMFGLYGRFENIGSEEIDAYFGIHIVTKGTLNVDEIIKSPDSMTLPSGSVAEMPITVPLGVGIFTVTYFIEGAGDDEGFYVEKTAKGVCISFFNFVIIRE